MITLDSVSKHFSSAKTPILNRISAVIPESSHLAILGPRRSGKSSLLKILCGMDHPTSGRVQRHTSVSFPIGFSGRSGKKVTALEHLSFVAKIYSVEYRELLTFVCDVAGLRYDQLKIPLIALDSALRKRINFAVGYALPFGCYLFDETVSGARGEDSNVFIELYERRRATASTILATRSVRAARQHCQQGGILYQGRLTLYSDVEEAITVFERLPEEDRFASNSNHRPEGDDTDDDEEF